MARPFKLLNKRKVKQIVESCDKYIVLAVKYGISESYVKMIKKRERDARRKEIKLSERIATTGATVTGG